MCTSLFPVLPKSTDFKDEEYGVGTGTSGTGKWHGSLGSWGGAAESLPGE